MFIENIVAVTSDAEGIEQTQYSETHEKYLNNSNKYAVLSASIKTGCDFSINVECLRH